MASFTKSGFVPMSLILSLKILLLVVTNAFLEDMISVLDLLYAVYYKSKVIFNSDKNYFQAYRRFKLVYSLARNSSLRLIKLRCFKTFPSNFDLSHQPDQIMRYWPP